MGHCGIRNIPTTLHNLYVGRDRESLFGGFISDDMSFDRIGSSGRMPTGIGLLPFGLERMVVPSHLPVFRISVIVVHPHQMRQHWHCALGAIHGHRLHLFNGSRAWPTGTHCKCGDGTPCSSRPFCHAYHIFFCLIVQINVVFVVQSNTFLHKTNKKTPFLYPLGRIFSGLYTIMSYLCKRKNDFQTYNDTKQYIKV